VALQGVIRLAPLSSFSAMTGCEHPIDIAAVSYIRFARSITYDGSNGSRRRADPADEVEVEVDVFAP
jgi:hypothetical protein